MNLNEPHTLSISDAVQRMFRDPVDPHKLMSTAKVTKLLDVSASSIDRWLADPEMKFPKPIVLSRNRYWREVEIRTWIDERAQQRLRGE
ncbi:hypothetical protein GCM10011415_06590 [Salipiger pallidus]|uniref:Transcriptional regulator, AlpA family n=1 Tax=Salipiger pallidus TaxID=1775170 RepID=A0A8J2ZHE7_9RHOB|nr:AlpA family phage regulatory protein [Salipiger pallidus]GGG62875.1 hypothetical protein GCM10011415_06590 [Salipiger pallidus]